MDVTDTAVDISMLSIQRLLNAVKSRVGIMYHSKVDNLSKFLRTHPSMLSWTDFGEAIVDRTRLPGSNVHDISDYLLHDWRKLSKQSPPQGLDKLIRILFQNGFDPQNVVNRKLRVFCHANEPSKSMPLVRSKFGDKVQMVDLLKESQMSSFSSKKMEL